MLVSVVVVWAYAGVAEISQQTIAWLGLNDQVMITLYHKAYAARWGFQPLGTGTAILVAALITAAIVGIQPTQLFGLNPVLIAATNSSGSVMGKMIPPQNIATGVSVTNLKGQEGVVFAHLQAQRVSDLPVRLAGDAAALCSAWIIP